MKVFALVASVLLAMTLPAVAADHQGKSIDNRKFPAKVYSYETGGVFEAEVEFKGDIATIYFINGGQLLIRLSQRSISDPTSILGYGRVGQLPLGRLFSIGLGGDNGLNGSFTVGAGPVRDLWRIMVAPGTFQ